MTSTQDGADATRAWRPAGLPIRVGLVGLGNIGLGQHVPALTSLPGLVRLVAVADPSADRRRLAANATGLDASAIHATPEELLTRTDLDVVDLATPPNIRTPLALRSIAAGMAVLCEKPLATVPFDGAMVVRAAAAAGIPVGMVHNYLAFPEIIAARTAIGEGTIGAPEVAILNYLGVVDHPGNNAWQPNWRHDPAVAGGGVLMDMLHVVYVAEALIGQPFRRVSAEILARTDQAPVEDIALCRFEADRAVALVNVGWGVGPGGIAVSGREGRIEITYAGGGTGPFAPLAAIRLVRRDGRVEDRMPAPAADQATVNVELLATLRDFFERLAAGRPPMATAADGLNVLEATLGAYASAATGRSVELPLDTEHPVHRRGIAGLADLPLTAGGAIARHGTFGIGNGGAI
ncbi:MAG: Gfo/Idh/MocA family protein [Candidatus Limnocylindrales bacterium]